MGSEEGHFQPVSATGEKKAGAVLAAPENVPKEEDESAEWKDRSPLSPERYANRVPEK